MLAWLLLLNGLFLLPALALPGAIPWLALEALAVWALLLVSPVHWRYRMAQVLGIGYGLLAFLIVADALIQESLGRGLNLYLEVGSLGPAWNLMVTNFGALPSFLGLLLLIVAMVGAGWCFRHTLGQLAHRSPSLIGKPVWLLTGLAVAGAVTPWIGSPAMAFVANQASLISHTHETTRSFSQRLKTEEGLTAQSLPGLAGKDVILGFIESYGMTVLTEDRYKAVVGPTLDTLARNLSKAGLTVATGRLESPIQGGQSWLGHLSVLSGQWIHNQLAYEILLSSGHATLIDDFRLTGHRAIGVMPAITGHWPEGRLFRYDQIFGRDDLNYQGPAFNWVTMPDQFTWHRFQTIREQSDQPLFAELALISSHAPWVPILPVLDDWENLKNGEPFQQWAGVGEAPASLWRDPDRVRDHYARAIRYALNIAGEFATRYLGENSLLILLGDHQPAPLITGDRTRRDVIVHVISADPALVAPFLSGALPGFQSGVRPEPDTAGAAMSELRPFMARHFNQPTF